MLTPGAVLGDAENLAERLAAVPHEELVAMAVDLADRSAWAREAMLSAGTAISRATASRQRRNPLLAGRGSTLLKYPNHAPGRMSPIRRYSFASLPGSSMPSRLWS